MPWQKSQRPDRQSSGSVKHVVVNYLTVEHEGIYRERTSHAAAQYYVVVLEGPDGADPVATVPASGAQELQMLRAERERVMLRAEVARCHAVGGPSGLMSTLIDRGDSPARKSGGNRFNPLQ